MDRTVIGEGVELGAATSSSPNIGSSQPSPPPSRIPEPVDYIAISLVNPAKMSDTGLPPQWEIRMSNSRGIPYYFHPPTQESRWEPPPNTDSDKLKAYMAANHSEAIAPSAPQAQKQKIRAAHLLVKHAGSRRPASWKEDPITRSKEEAMAIILGHEQRIRGGMTTLAELASTESDCSSARKGGDLGNFGKGDMQKEFEDAAFALTPGEMSSVVETASGLHLIERLA
ncbi:hypothetical protein Dda_7837 [Drechslerella dactyloides]|uniref:Peptidyl-prolyl cis-trans isomerase n=1 Tax=Drechslerella dactyloides TaxID=74499 RepID=A0AAD6IS65_DREDA|nr:hypothetical protein Dda_7837 [Drechslerella dactyloides]